MDNKAIVKRIFEDLWTKGHVSTVDEFVSRDFVGHWPFLVEPIKGQAEYKEFVAEMRKVFPDLSMKVLDYVSEGERVVARFEVTGTHRAEFLTVPSTNRMMTVEGLSISRIVKGKIVETRVQMDTLAMLRALEIISPKIAMHPLVLIR
jgi:steroid delta-isomerase-like uncharacterized protein